jgi:hypothetical protein
LGTLSWNPSSLKSEFCHPAGDAVKVVVVRRNGDNCDEELFRPPILADGEVVTTTAWSADSRCQSYQKLQILVY